MTLSDTRTEPTGIDKYRAIDPNFLSPKTQPGAHRAMARARTRLAEIRTELRELGDQLRGQRLPADELAMYRERRANLRGQRTTIGRHYAALKLWIAEHYALRPGEGLSGVLVEDLFAELRRRTRGMEIVVAAAVTFVEAETVREEDGRGDRIHEASRVLGARDARLALFRAVAQFLGELPEEASEEEDDGGMLPNEEPERGRIWPA